ncbi:ABC transporter permease [Bacillus sp. FJAT-27264]|uniref:ABC transporter permease n=1 Tax=Paenibacillus sp. (strain DSM 101736 / FJAT-27264) TaxID=1850362 RepID=UPI00256FBB78|nr:ABC transporter permease [Bacillus sp. FJAT-27264]
MNHFWNTLQEDWPVVVEKTLEHIELSLLSLALACLISIPFGIYLARHKRLANSVITVVSAVQTIPVLALFGFMVPVFGIGFKPALIVLTFYGILPVLQNTYVGITSVSPALTEAGRGMGMSNWQLLWMVQVPIARSYILAGVRLMAIQMISMATIGTFIAAGGLGDIITTGINDMNTARILEGAIPVSLLVILINIVLLQLNRFLTPKGLRKNKSN